MLITTEEYSAVERDTPGMSRAETPANPGSGMLLGGVMGAYTAIGSLTDASAALASVTTVGEGMGVGLNIAAGVFSLGTGGALAVAGVVAIGTGIKVAKPPELMQSIYGLFALAEASVLTGGDDAKARKIADIAIILEGAAGMLRGITSTTKLPGTGYLMDPKFPMILTDMANSGLQIDAGTKDVHSNVQDSSGHASSQAEPKKEPAQKPDPPGPPHPDK